MSSVMLGERKGPGLVLGMSSMRSEMALDEAARTHEHHYS